MSKSSKKPPAVLLELFFAVFDCVLEINILLNGCLWVKLLLWHEDFIVKSMTASIRTPVALEQLKIIIFLLFCYTVGISPCSDQTTPFMFYLFRRQSLYWNILQLSVIYFRLFGEHLESYRHGKSSLKALEISLDLDTVTPQTAISKKTQDL